MSVLMCYPTYRLGLPPRAWRRKESLPSAMMAFVLPRPRLSYGLLIVALVLALWGVNGMVTAPPGVNPWAAVILPLTLAALAVVAAQVLTPPAPTDQMVGGEQAVPMPMPTRFRAHWAVGVASGAAALLTATLVVLSGDRVVASGLWLLSWALMIVAVLPWRLPAPAQARSFLGRHHWEIALLVAILAIATAYRLPDLTGLPGTIHNDEGAVGLQARADVGPGAPPLLSLGWAQLPQLGYLYAGLFLRGFGDNLWALRFSSVVAGLASIVLLYLLARDLFGRRVAVLAAAFLTISHVHIHWSRMGGHYIHPIMMVPLALWLGAHALKTNRPIYYVLAGLALTLCLQFYFGARIAFLLLPVLLVASLAANQHLARTRWPGLLLLGSACAVSLTPLLLMIHVDDPSALAGRVTYVMLFNTSNMDIVHHYVTNPAHYYPWSIVWQQVQRIPLIFSTAYDSSLQHPVQAPITDQWTSALVFLGLVVCLLRLRRPGYLLALVWFVAVLGVGGVIITDFPFGPRISALIPALALLPALYLDVLWTSAEQAMGVFRAWLPIVSLCAGLLAVAGWTNYQIYNVSFKANPQDPATTLAHYLTRRPAGQPIYLWHDRPDLSHQAIQFLNPGLVTYDAENAAQLPALERQHGPGVVYLAPQDWGDAPLLQRALAGATIVRLVNNVGQAQFMTVQPPRVGF